MTSAPVTQTTPPEGTPRTSWMQLGVISASEFVVWAGFGAIIPYLPLFLEEQAHASMTLWAVIAAMFYVGTLLFSSPLGWLSDIIGRKPVMIGGAVVYTVALLLFTTTTDPYWFILFRLLEGIGTAAFGPAAQSFVADITTEENRSKAYGFLTTAQFGGLIVGPALAAPLYALGGGGTSGFYAIFYFGAILSAIALTAIVFFVREPAALKTRRTQRRRDREANLGWRVSLRNYRAIFTPPILAFVLIAFTSHYAMGAWDVVWSLYLSHLGASKTYISMTWVAFSVPMLLSFVGGMFADRYSRFWLFVVGYALSSLAWMFYGISTNLVALIVVNVLEGFAIAFSYPGQAGVPDPGEPQALARYRHRRRGHVHAAGRAPGLADGAAHVRQDLGTGAHLRRHHRHRRTVRRRADPLPGLEPAQGGGRHADAGRARAARRRDEVRVRGGAAARTGVRPGESSDRPGLI